jgi:hypothetical protein
MQADGTAKNAKPGGTTRGKPHPTPSSDALSSKAPRSSTSVSEERQVGAASPADGCDSVRAIASSVCVGMCKADHPARRRHRDNQFGKRLNWFALADSSPNVSYQRLHQIALQRHRNRQAACLAATVPSKPAGSFYRCGPTLEYGPARNRRPHSGSRQRMTRSGSRNRPVPIREKPRNDQPPPLPGRSHNRNFGLATRSPPGKIVSCPLHPPLTPAWKRSRYV